MMSIPKSFASGASLSGSATIPGDKSISHRSIIFASQALGTTHIEKLLVSEDVLATIGALRKLGIRIQQNGGAWEVEGKGVGGLQPSNDIIDCGNSGTSIRLLMGLVSPYQFPTFFTGDQSLRGRPMGRVITPLSQMGATFHSRDKGRPPLMVQGNAHLLPITYRLPVASAQVKSAILLAAMNTAGTTTVIEPRPSRDHSERMLNAFGWQCETASPQADAPGSISLTGQQQAPRQDREIHIPADPSSAAFPIVAALISPHSSIQLPSIGLNPHRTGLFTTLQEMGAKLTLSNKREVAGEPVGDIQVESSPLNAVTVPASRAPSMIDEYPILAVAAAVAQGTSRFCGLAELRVKESDRLTRTAEGLKACGINAEIEGDDLIIHGSGGQMLPGGATIDSGHDHRIAMSFLLLGLQCHHPVKVSGCEAIASSFPEFFAVMASLGVHEPPPPMLVSQNTAATNWVIAIDGPAASGKGTLARRIAQKLGLRYLDTGSLYRAVGLKLLYNDQSPEDETAATAAAESIEWQDLQNPRLRQEKVGHAASIVSAMPAVRSALLAFQQRIANDERGAVLDGRDIGTTICPNAPYKFFITANLETRAHRRHRELTGQGITVIYESVLQDLKERDNRDQQRDHSPLIPAKDALIIDTSTLSTEEVFEKVLHQIQPSGDTPSH